MAQMLGNVVVLESSQLILMTLEVSLNTIPNSLFCDREASD